MHEAGIRLSRILRVSEQLIQRLRSGGILPLILKSLVSFEKLDSFGGEGSLSANIRDQLATKIQTLQDT